MNSGMKTQDTRKIVVKAMERHGVHQMELSRRAKVPQETLSRWFRLESQSIGSKRLERIFKVLKIKVSPKKGKDGRSTKNQAPLS